MRTLILILITTCSFSALSATDMWLVCQRLSERGNPKSKIKTVMIFKQTDTTVHDGSLMMNTYGSVGKVKETNWVPFTVKIFRAEVAPDNLSGAALRDYAVNLYSDDTKVSESIELVGRRLYHDYIFIHADIEEENREDANYFLDVSGVNLHLSHYTNGADNGPMNCFKPMNIKSNPEPAYQAPTPSVTGAIAGNNGHQDANASSYAAGTEGANTDI